MTDDDPILKIQATEMAVIALSLKRIAEALEDLTTILDNRLAKPQEPPRTGVRAY